MSNLRVWKLIGGFVLLFGLGGVCGAAYTSHRTGWVNHPAPTDKWSERWFAQTAESLEVREEQMKALRPMMEDMQRQLRDLQKETTARADAVIKQTGRRMWEVLDETQRERYRAFDSKQKLSRQAITEPPSPAKSDR